MKIKENNLGEKCSVLSEIPQVCCNKYIAFNHVYLIY